ncbi:MAG: pyridoxamine 5'-phosphate oxidase, partial [Thiohalocapsa sp.]
MTDEHFYNDLDATFDQVWQRLGRGAVDRRSGFHTVQLASVGLDGAPRVRTVVLRGVARGE